jgi:hypothetical protein
MNSRAQKLLKTLQDELQYALEDAVVGQNMSASLTHQLKRTANNILYRHRITKAQITIQQQGSGFEVTVVIPPQGPIVQTVRLVFS